MKNSEIRKLSAVTTAQVVPLGTRWREDKEWPQRLRKRAKASDELFISKDMASLCRATFASASSLSASRPSASRTLMATPVGMLLQFTLMTSCIASPSERPREIKGRPFRTLT